MRIRNNKASKNISMPEVEIEVETESPRAKRAKRVKENKHSKMPKKEITSEVEELTSEDKVIAPKSRRLKRSKTANTESVQEVLPVEESNESFSAFELNKNESNNESDTEATGTTGGWTEVSVDTEKSAVSQRRVRQRRSGRVSTDVVMESENEAESVDLSNAESILATTPTTRKKRTRRSVTESSALKPREKVNKEREEKTANSDMFNFFSVDDDDDDDIVPEEKVEEETFTFFNDIKGDEDVRMVLDAPETVNENDNVGKFKDIEFPDIRKPEEPKEPEESEEIEVSEEIAMTSENNIGSECVVTDTETEFKAETEVKSNAEAETKTETEKKVIAPEKKLISRLEEAAKIYNTKDSGVYSEDITIKYYDEESLGVTVDDNGILSMPNAYVYVNGVKVAWDNVNETRVSKKDVIELDLGVGLTIPEGYELQIAGAKNLEDKYGLKLIEQNKRIVRQAALFPIVVRLSAIKDLAYIQKYRSIIKARLVAV